MHSPSFLLSFKLLLSTLGCFCYMREGSGTELECLNLLRVIKEPLAHAVIERALTLITVGPLGASRVLRSHLRTVTHGIRKRTAEGLGSSHSQRESCPAFSSFPSLCLPPASKAVSAKKVRAKIKASARTYSWGQWPRSSPLFPSLANQSCPG